VRKPETATTPFLQESPLGCSFVLLSMNYKFLSMLLHLISTTINFTPYVRLYLLFAIINKALVFLISWGKCGYLLMFISIMPHLEWVLNKCALTKSQSFHQCPAAYSGPIRVSAYEVLFHCMLSKETNLVMVFCSILSTSDQNRVSSWKWPVL
jgi:hypothetical protein